MHNILYSCFIYPIPKINKQKQNSVLFVMLGKILAPYKTPPFTLPFNVSTILFLLAMGGMNNVDMAPVRTPGLPSYEVEDVEGLTAEAFFAGSIRGEYL